MSKDLTSLYLHVGYSGLYIKELNKKENIDSSTKKVLQQILTVMKKFRLAGLSIYAAFMIAMPLLILWLYILTVSHTFGMEQIISHRIVSGREIIIFLGTAPFIAVFGGISGVLWYVRYKFKRTITSLLESIGSEKLSSVIEE